MWRMSGVLVGIAWPLVGLGQHPGWVQELPWIRAKALYVQSWSAGETFSFQHHVRLPAHWSLAAGFTKIGSFSRLAVCTGPQVPLAPLVSAQLRLGFLAQRWALAEEVRGVLRPNVHLLLQGQGNDGEAVTLGFGFAPEGPLPRVQARDELVIKLEVFSERNGQQLQARCTRTAAGLALEWQWMANVHGQSKLGLIWRMLPGYLGIHGSREFESYRWSVGLLRGVRHGGFCLALAMEAC